MATAPSVGQQSRARASGLLALASSPLPVALAVLAVLVALRAQGSVDADVAWQLWIGRQLNHGAHLYRDIVETNPPLWFWMAMPIERLSTLAHLRSDHLLILLVGAAAALSVVAVDRLVGPMSRGRRTILLTLASLVLAAVPGVDFAQREHLALIGALPYAALIGSRREQRQIPAALAFGIGIGAALGFAFKHYFLIVPALLELWLLARLEKKWRPVRPESIAILAVGILYAAAVLLWARDYLTNMVPMLELAYGATGAKRVVDLFQPPVIAGLASIALLLPTLRVRDEGSAQGAALAVAAMGFACAYFIQAKGWSYHALPMLGCAAMALAWTVVAGKGAYRLMLLAAPALLLLPFTIAAQHAFRQPDSAQDVEQAVDGMRARDTVAFISADPSFGWTVIPEKDLRFVLRSNGFWMMQAVVANELRGGPDKRLTKLGERVIGETVQDFECTPPRRIIVKRPRVGATGEFDILAFFMRDPRFAALLAHYRPIERTSVEVFEQESPLDRPAGCPRWSPV